MKRYIKVHNQFNGVHCWSKCPYDEVKFLKHPHRHVFHVYTKALVEHSDRAVEFFLLQADVQKAIVELYGRDEIIIDKKKVKLDREVNLDLGERSCEMVCEDLYNTLFAKYKKAIVSIETSEDNENFAIVEF